MAAAVDQAKFLADKILEKLNSIRDVLALIGIFYTTKVSLKLASSVFYGMRTFVLPFLLKSELQRYGKWAVVTGCTDGIGKAYCEVLAKKGLNIVLISRNADKLKSTAHHLEVTHNVETHIISADFTQGRQIYQQISEELTDKDIGLLVNNVGVMVERPMLFEEVSAETLWNHVMVNVGAVTMMTNIVLPQMVKRGRGAIINVSSSAAIYPLPLMAVYSATKVYVDYLSRALHEEYRGSGLVIQSLMPFYVATEMTKFSRTLHRSKWLVPSALTYASHSLPTLGHSSRTTGYWSHGLQHLLVSCVPEVVWLRCGFLIQKFLQGEAVAKKTKRSRYMAEFLPQEDNS